MTVQNTIYPSGGVCPTCGLYHNTWECPYKTYPSPNTTFPTTTTFLKTVKEPVKTPELYPEDLDTLKEVIKKLDTMLKISGVLEIEIRVRLDEVDCWAVVGVSGETGDACILRFDPYKVV